MVIYGGGRRFAEILEKYGFKIVNEFKLLENPKMVEIYILASSSAILYINGDKILVDVFPCDVENPNSLPIRVSQVISKTLEFIPEDNYHEGEFFGVPFWITKPKRNNEFLGVNGNKKLVGYAEVYTNFRIYYYGSIIKTHEEILLSKNYETLLKRVKKIFGKKFIELRTPFGDEFGYSAVFFKECRNNFLFITIHTWPESETAHIEIISDKEVDPKKILKNLFKEGYIELSKYEKR